MNRYINLFSNSILAALTIFIVLFIFSSFKERSNPAYVSGIGVFKFMHVITGSMNPAINIGDIIITKAVDGGSLKNGDIITFRTSSNVLVTHRIKEINENGSFVTKGDANDVKDINFKVNMDNIIGKYVFKIPKGAYALEFIQTPTGMILFILVSIAALLGGEVKILTD